MKRVLIILTLFASGVIWSVNGPLGGLYVSGVDLSLKGTLKIVTSASSSEFRICMYSSGTKTKTRTNIISGPMAEGDSPMTNLYKDTSTIYDSKTEKTIMIFENVNAYMELTEDHSDLSGNVADLPDVGEMKQVKIGSSFINGWKCTQYRIKHTNGAVTDLWKTEKDGIVVKYVHTDKDTKVVFEVSEYSKDPVSPEEFTPPANSRKVGSAAELLMPAGTSIPNMEIFKK